MLPMRLFRSARFSAGNAAMFLLFGSALGSIFFMAQFLWDPSLTKEAVVRRFADWQTADPERGERFAEALDEIRSAAGVAVGLHAKDARGGLGQRIVGERGVEEVERALGRGEVLEALRAALEAVLEHGDG